MINVLYVRFSIEGGEVERFPFYNFKKSFH